MMPLKKIAASFKDRIADLIVLSAKRDIGHQRNVGARHARFRYLLFLDADVLLPRDMLSRLAIKVPAQQRFVAGVMHRFERMGIIDHLFFGIGCMFLGAFLLSYQEASH